MWFDSWSDVLRILVVGVLAYALLVAILRVSGKRTLAQLNAFDFVVTVALGSTLASIILSGDVSFSEGALALALLACLQFLVAWVSAHFSRVRDAVTSGPALLVVDGRVDHEALTRHRLEESEVRQAVRMAGRGDLSDVAAVVLETNGTLSVITRDALGDGWAMADLPGSQTLSPPVS